MLKASDKNIKEVKRAEGDFKREWNRGSHTISTK